MTPSPNLVFFTSSVRCSHIRHSLMYNAITHRQIKLEVVTWIIFISLNFSGFLSLLLCSRNQTDTISPPPSAQQPRRANLGAIPIPPAMSSTIP